MRLSDLNSFQLKKLLLVNCAVWNISIKFGLSMTTCLVMSAVCNEAS